MRGPSQHNAERDALHDYARSRGLIATGEFLIPQREHGRRARRVDLYVHGCAHEPNLVVEYKTRITSRCELVYARRQVGIYLALIDEVFGSVGPIVPLVVSAVIGVPPGGEPAALTSEEFCALLDRRCNRSECHPLFRQSWKPAA